MSKSGLSTIWIEQSIHQRWPNNRIACDLAQSRIDASSGIFIAFAGQMFLGRRRPMVHVFGISGWWLIVACSIGGPWTRTPWAMLRVTWRRLFIALVVLLIITH